MKKLISLLLCALVATALITSGIALAQDEVNFAQMKPQEQYEYLKTLQSEEEITQALRLLTGEQLEALEAYRLSVETQSAVSPEATPEASPETTPGGGGQGFAEMTPEEQYEYCKTLQSEKEVAQALSLLTDDQLAAFEAYRLAAEAQQPEESPEATSGASPEAAPDASQEAVSGEDERSFVELTPEEQYAYLLTVESDEEFDALIGMLSTEQYAAFMDYALAMGTETAGTGETAVPAVDFTHAAPFMDPVDISVRMMARSFAMRALDAPQEDDALVLDKRVSGSAGSYLLTIEAYATGEVSITTGETPVPADIIMVLDTSLSMDSGMTSGYSPVTFNTNSEAYNYGDDLFVKVDEQYYALTITRTKTGGNGSNTRYQYTYSYRIGTTPYTYTSDSNASNDPPPAWAFYHATTVSRLEALKTAANSFIDSIEQKANLGDGVDHRIAVVTYSTAANIISGGSASAAFVNVHNNTGGINTLQNAITGLDTVMYTRSDLGLQKAVDIFQQDPPDTSGLRNRVVVFFTDGAPASSGDGSFQASVANPAIASAKTLKAATSASGYGATVYSIGIFSGADPTAAISGASNENKFMHFVSSNYPGATSMTNYGTGSNAGYYLSASNTTGLSNIFQSISDNIETGGTTVTLDETSVIKDMIAPYFQLPAGAAASDIHLYTSSVDSSGGWLPRVAFNGNVTISPDRKTIGISGFDYADNYYAAIKTNGVITGYQGKKLIIEIPIVYINGSCFGGTVPTNKPVSGVYDDDLLVEALPIPMVDIPVNYDFTPVDQSIYLTQDATLNGLFTTSAGYIADGANNAYVNIVYNVKSGGTSLGTYTILAGHADGSWNISSLAVSGLKANTVYTVECTVTPVGGPVVPAVVTKTATVYVWKPELTWRDSIIYLGEAADYGNNFVSAVWKNTSTSAPVPTGLAPALSYEYTPNAAAFTLDTNVAAAVSIGSDNITAYTHFIHEACSKPGCGFNPASAQFMVHINTCSLTITKTGAADATDTFLFTVTGGGLTLHVSVQGNGSITIVGLPVGSYTVAEESEWSWRYTAADKQVTLDASHPAGSVSVGNSVSDNKWLAGDSHAVNTFPYAG